MSRDFNWVGTSRDQKNFMQENFGLMFRSLSVQEVPEYCFMYGCESANVQLILCWEPS